MSEDDRVVELPRTVSAVPAPPVYTPQQGEPDEGDEPTLIDHLAVLRQNRWLIAGVALCVLAADAAYLVLSPPRYRADVLVQVEEKEQGLGSLTDLASTFSEKTPTETEMEILRSRTLTGGLVDALALDIAAAPDSVPVVGAALLRRWRGQGFRPPVFGLSAYAWGGERIRVDRMSVPDHLRNEAFRLIAGEEGRFWVEDPEGTKLLDGKVGEAAAAGDVELFVSELVARPGTRFTLIKRWRDESVGSLQGSLSIAEKGKKTGIILISLEGKEPQRLAAILDTLAQTYQRQNVQRKSLEAERTLQFVESQLPLLSKELEAAERALNEYRQNKRSVDLSLETKAALDSLAVLEKSLTQLSLEQLELRQRFTQSHPLLGALAQKASRLQGEKAAIEAQLQKLPQKDMESVRLVRTVKTTNEQYLLLVNKAQELSLLKSGTVGNVRLLDGAVIPRRPLFPHRNPALALGLGLFVGVLLGGGLAFVRSALTDGVSDPELVERATGVSVYATVPHSTRQSGLNRLFSQKGSGKLPVLAIESPDDLSVEALKSLRSALLFSMLESRSKTVVIGGVSPEAGKSFVAVNLACLLAGLGKKVLLVDADMRRGHLHKFFGLERPGGLAEVVAGSFPLASVLRPSVAPGLDFLSTGVFPPNPTELLSSDRFRNLLDSLCQSYDLVVLDSAPILAVTDGAILGRLAGVNLLVLRAGDNPLAEIQLAVKRLRQNSVVIHGAVMNDIQVRHGRGTYSYQYEYKTSGA